MNYLNHKKINQKVFCESDLITFYSSVSHHNLDTAVFFYLGCFKGYRYDSANDECVICPRNTYSDTTNADTCTPCQADPYPHHTLTAGQISNRGSTRRSDCRKKNNYIKNSNKVKLATSFNISFGKNHY